MDIDQAIEAFRSGSFAIDFPTVCLRQDAGAEALVLTGAGSVRTDADGVLELTTVSPIPSVGAMLKDFNRGFRRQPGQLYGDDDYYEVTADDADGQKWSGGKCRIHPSWSLPEGKVTSRAKLRFLSLIHASVEEKSSLKLMFVEQDARKWRALVQSSRAVTIDDPSFAFRLSIVAESDDRLVLEATTDKRFPEAFDVRLIEALQFVLGRPVQASLIDRVENGSRVLTLRRRSEDDDSGIVPPIDVSDTLYAPDAAQLFERYLNHACATAEPGLVAPSSGFLALVRNARATSIESWSIGLCIAVEGLAKLIDVKIPIAKDEHARLRKAFPAWMAEAKFDPALIDRVGGLLSILNQTRPEDLMKAIAAKGFVRGSDITEWRELRNRQVHTRKSSAKDGSHTAVQEQVDSVHTVTRLMYSIVFQLIGYRGLFADHGTHGFPERTYPFAS